MGSGMRVVRMKFWFGLELGFGFKMRISIRFRVSIISLYECG